MTASSLGRLIAVACLAAICGGGWWYLRQDIPHEQLLGNAQAALKAGQYAGAEQLAVRALLQQPGSPQALLTAGESASRMGRLADALAYYAEIPDDSSDDAILAAFATGELLFHAGRWEEALGAFNRLLHHVPQHALANGRCLFILATEQRRWESMPYALELLRQKQFQIEELLLLASPVEVVNQTTLLQGALSATPGDLRPLIGIGAVHEAKRQMADAEKTFRQVVEKLPDCVEAQARLGLVLLNEFPERFLAWHAQLPAECDRHPDIWYVRGAWAQDHGEYDVAARCLWEALRLYPSHQYACYRLSQLLVARGDSATADLLAKRAEALHEIAVLTHIMLSHGPAPERVLKAAVLTAELGRLWESAAFYKVLLDANPNLKDARKELIRIELELKRNSHAAERGVQALTLLDLNPIARLDLSSLPLPNWSSEDAAPIPAAAPRQLAGVRFGAAAAGINFQCISGDDPTKPGMMIGQEMSGGIAVVDYDGDFLPDLYMSQGGAWPPQNRPDGPLDQLFRNLGDGQAASVTAGARVVEDGYSQGVAAGDYNNDGFQDIYVANIGVNRLYRNNGDGTFDDVTQQAGIAGAEAWSTSCMIADLNLDGLPDIYDVTYLAGREPLDTVCKDGERERACTPGNFMAEQDRVWVNLGDGTFQDQSAQCGILADRGNGLGIVAADFEADGRLSIFIANDETDNFYFKNLTEPGGPLLFEEKGSLTGLAVDRTGKPQACMGVAAGDANGDGLLDLYITNFYHESNTLYMQQSPGMFSDETRAVGLREPSMDTLGFGTQFIDGELDGKPDLVVSNGHVDDFSDRGTPFQMQPQYYQNLGGGNFAEVPQQQLGEYFLGKYLGRSLARLDWNRDGKEDFIVAHLDAPTALVLNETPSVGHFLAVRLRAVQTARDAIGTSVTAKAEGTTWVQQLTGGDGFQASNERRLVFGLGAASQVEELSIRWPSGAVQDFAGLPADQELLLIEGREAPIAVPMVSRTPNSP